MPAKNLSRKNEEGVYCHVYNKGVEQRLIFNDQADYQVFQGFLKDYLTAPQDPESTKQVFTVHGRNFRGTPHQPKNYFNKVELIAYNLMPDHFHLLLYQKAHGSIESFIRSICTRYSIYFNKKYQRTGSLFEGPYKSVQIIDNSQLLHLTSYLHHIGSHTSCPEYLGTRITQWVNPKIVLSIFAQVMKTYSNKIVDNSDYKDFIAKYQPDQKGKELLSRITFEAEGAHLERIATENKKNYPPENPIKPVKKLSSTPNLKPHQRAPEFLAAMVIFLLLSAIGITNIMISTGKKSSQPLILGIETMIVSPDSNSKPSTPAVTPTPTPVSSAVPQTTETNKTPADTVSTASASLATMVTINIGDGSGSVNIRQKPAVNSPKVGKAKNGDTFELVSADPDWIGIKLPDGSTGYITSKYIKKGVGN